MLHHHIGNTLIHLVDKTFGTVPSVSIDHFAEEVQRHACHDEHLDQSDFHEKSKIYFFSNFIFSKREDLRICSLPSGILVKHALLSYHDT